MAWPSTARASTALWVQPSTHKVRTIETPGPTAHASIAAAKNEFEAFQIVVNDPAGVKQIDVTTGNFTGPGGHVIPASAVRFYRVDLINLLHPSDQDGHTGRWPDPLVPKVDDLDGTARHGFPFDAAPNESRAIWTEILVPTTATAGNYTGTITVTTHGALLGHVPVSLRVFDFALPSTPTLRTYYQANDMSVCQGHYHGDASCGNSDANKVKLLDSYARFALDHRISLGNVFYLWPHATTPNWSTFDATYGPLLNGTAHTRLAGAKLTSAKYMGPFQATALSHFDGHFSDKGWISRAFDYTADEPQSDAAFHAIASRAQQLKLDAPGVRSLVTTSSDKIIHYGLQKLVNIVVPVVNYMEGKPGYPYAGNQRSTYNTLQAGGSQIWMYQSCMSHGCGPTGAVGATGSGYPSIMIDHSATRNRAMHWASFHYGVSGDLYWETLYAYGQGNAWTNQYYFTGNGDGTLFYPGTPDRVGGTTHTPVASQRLKMLRAGVQDYEYLVMCSKLGDPNFAKQEAAKVIPEAYAIGDDPTRMLEARIALGTRIEQLTHGAK
jgi:hypothetical protein